MAYSEDLAGRIRAALAQRNDVSERRMFGGLCFMVAGHMACGVLGDVLMLRLGDGTAAALRRPHTRVMDFTGRPSANMIYVDPPGLKTAAALHGWIKQAEAFVDSQPPKAAGTGARPRPKGAKSRSRPS